MKPIYITLTKTRHKSQPWVFTIDRPGPQRKETKRERYATMWSAKRGALRSLRYAMPGASGLWFYAETNGKLRVIKFIVG